MLQFHGETNHPLYKIDIRVIINIKRYRNEEIIIIEDCNVFDNVLMSKIQFKDHKGLCGTFTMLRVIALKYRYTFLTTFKKIAILFLHTKETLCNSSLYNISTGCLFPIALKNTVYRWTSCPSRNTLYNCIEFSKDYPKKHLHSLIETIDALNDEYSNIINDAMLGHLNINEKECLLSNIVRLKKEIGKELYVVVVLKKP
ncbi:hypothetical protein K501DRAFT_270466 [Backusella circina FSU 941]|nr:hypothetical protein K501DRAFT_270466 [Backusella circina FSU 941]